MTDHEDTRSGIYQQSMVLDHSFGRRCSAKIDDYGVSAAQHAVITAKEPAACTLYRLVDLTDFSQGISS
jgi:hypothetical protein